MSKSSLPAKHNGCRTQKLWVRVIKPCFCKCYEKSTPLFTTITDNSSILFLNDSTLTRILKNSKWDCFAVDFVECWHMTPFFSLVLVWPTLLKSCLVIAGRAKNYMALFLGYISIHISIFLTLKSIVLMLELGDRIKHYDFFWPNWLSDVTIL